MNRKQLSLTLLCLLTTGTTTTPKVKNFNKIDIPTLQVIQPKEAVQVVKRQPNLLCDSNKYITYTNIDKVKIDWTYIDNNYYVDDQGFVRENGTNAIYCAMATNYKKNNYYTITTNANQTFKVKVVDVKSDNHTTNSCYTTHDNSIVELWLTNKNVNFKNLGNSKVVGVSVTEIKE